MDLQKQALRTRVLHLEYAIGRYLHDGDRDRLARAYSNEWVQPLQEIDMTEVEIVERKSYFGKPSRIIVSGPSWQALKVWRDEQNVGAPSATWLRDAAADALDEIERLRGLIGESDE